MELKHSTTSLNTKQKDLKQNDTAYEKDKAIIEKSEREIKALEQQMSKIRYQDGQLEQLQERHRVLTTEIRDMRNEVNRKFDHFEFKYSDPAPNFDRRKVKGMIANLITVEDDKYSQVCFKIIKSFNNCIINYLNLRPSQLALVAPGGTS